MKTLSIYAVIVFSIFISNNSIAQKALKKETIKVWGNCSMCKTNIEKAAKKAGATAASWNEETKNLKVSYAVSKTSNEKIQTGIAKAGYDTEAVTADDAVYKKLHSCCQYERKGSNVNTEKAVVSYCCPMHADVTSAEPGKCGKCGMDLTKSKKEQMKMEVMKQYSCPMHADVKSDKPGKCSKCNMDLKENNK